MNKSQSSLDHILLGSSDLEHGVAWVEEQTGVRAAFGGVHPGRGTRNALLQLGPHRYLEILAPDPQQSSQSPYGDLRVLKEPRLVAWAAHTDDIEAVAERARKSGFALIGPDRGSRITPDGKTLHWKSLRLQNDGHGLLPFFIEWDLESVHPAADAPAGCRLDSFVLRSQNRPDLEKSRQQLGVDVTIEAGEKSCLYARISGPQGKVELAS